MRLDRCFHDCKPQSVAAVSRSGLIAAVEAVKDIMTLGPIGIHPDYKRQGCGKILLDYSMEKATAMGAGALCFEGNIDFYGKSGFVVASTMGIHYYAEPRDSVVPYFLCKELKKGYLDGISGTYHTPQGYFVDDQEVEAFDKSFPAKEKLKLPGQLW